VASNLRMRVEEAQRLLECEDPIERLRLVNEQLVKEAEVAAMQAKIQNMAKEGMDKAAKGLLSARADEGHSAGNWAKAARNPTSSTS